MSFYFRLVTNIIVKNVISVLMSDKRVLETMSVLLGVDLNLLNDEKMDIDSPKPSTTPSSTSSDPAPGPKDVPDDSLSPEQKEVSFRTEFMESFTNRDIVPENPDMCNFATES